MADFKEYTMSGGTVGPVDEAQLDALVRALRVVYSRPYPARASNRAFRPSGVDRGGVASAAARTVHGRSGGALCAFACRPDRPFPEGGGHRIVAEEGEVVEEVRTEAELSGDDDLVTEDLAEIYLAQGLCDEAIAIYRKLSLLNPEKSVYFASLIDKIANK